MRKCKLLCVIGIIILILSSCDKGGDVSLPISNINENAMNIVTTTYSDKEIDKIRSYEGNIEQLNYEFPIQCLRKDEFLYRAIYKGEKKILIICFDLNGNKTLAKTYNAEKTISDFNAITIGQTLDSVRQVDPLGDYTFLYTGRNDLPKTSVHCTSDGYLVRIFYDGTLTVTKFEKSMF